MFSINRLCFMSNFSFKEILYTGIVHGGQTYSSPHSLSGGYNITGHQLSHSKGDIDICCVLATPNDIKVLWKPFNQCLGYGARLYMFNTQKPLLDKYATPTKYFNMCL